MLFLGIFQENFPYVIEEDQRNYQHAPSTVHRTIKYTMWGMFIFKIHTTSPKSGPIYYPPTYCTVGVRYLFEKENETFQFDLILLTIGAAPTDA